MSRIFSIFLFLPMYFLIMVLVFYIALTNYENQSVEEFRLKKAINYCIDAATAEMLETGDLGMDYANWGKFKTNPDLAVEAYANAFCLNYGLQTNKENRELVEHAYTRLFVVCAYDGYYVYEPKMVSEDGDYAFVSTPKLPYSYTNGNTSYALNLGLKDCWRFSSTNKLSKVDTPLSETATLREINKRVSDDLAYRLDQQFENGWTKSLYIPFEVTTVSSTNAINRPSVLAFADNIDIVSAKKISAFGVGGAHVSQARSVAAYRRNGQKYYAYSDLLPENMFTATNPDGSKTFIEAMFMTCKEAAEAGYYHDTLFMN